MRAFLNDEAGARRIDGWEEQVDLTSPGDDEKASVRVTSSRNNRWVLFSRDATTVK